MVFYFRTVVDTFEWIAGSFNHADSGTKLDSSFTEVLVLSLEAVILPIYLTDYDFSRRDQSFG